MIGSNPLKEMLEKIPVPPLKEILRIDGMSKSFSLPGHEVQALRNVHCTIYEGEMVAIMGTSGSGKSTLLNMISAIDEPTNGQFYVFGEEAGHIYKEPYASKFRQEQIGFIFQDFHLLKDLNVEDNIAIPLILQDVPSKEIARKLEHVMKQLGIYGWRKHRVQQLSGGQKQRVAIARAIIHEPPILLADEPTGALDLNTTDEILALLGDLQQKGQTIILVTHDPYVATFAKRVLFFQDGRIVDSYHNSQSNADLDEIMERLKAIARGER